MQSTDNVTQYPEWQQKARAAQALKNQQFEEKRRAADAEEAEAERKRGEALGTALSFLGITSGPLERNRFELDGFTFQLQKMNSLKYMSIGPNRDDKSQNYAWFELGISKVPEMTEEEKDNFSYGSCFETLTVSNVPLLGDWTNVLADFADCLDRVQRAYGYVLENLQSYRQRQAGKFELRARQQPEQAEKQHTPADKLLMALQGYIESITPQRESDTYDF